MSPTSSTSARSLIHVEQSCARGCCESQAAHYRSLVFGVPDPAARTQIASDRRLEEDRHAYKRLRDEGLQPKSLRGASVIEKRADSKFEVETGRILPQSLSKRIDSAVVEAAQVTGQA